MSDLKEELTESLRTAIENKESTQEVGRRTFLKNGLALAVASTLPFEFAAMRGAYAASTVSPYGPLQLATDESTGLQLLKLPAGFRYMSYSRIDDRMDDGIPTPGRHDGMGICKVDDGRLHMVRNHEIAGGSTTYSLSGKKAKPISFAPASFAATYDAIAPGGTTNLVFDTVRGRWEGARASLAGTVLNCSGGVTPWGSWLTCEETINTTGVGPTRKFHGYVFDVPVDGIATAEPLRAMGRFQHEAAVVVDKPGDPEDGFVYMTEDNGLYKVCGVYRFRPNVYGDLTAGTLEVLKIRNIKNAVMYRETVKQWGLEWLPVPDPQDLGIFARGKKLGCAIFHKCEGAWYSHAAHAVWFVVSNGPNRSRPRIYKIDIATQTLHMVFESPSDEVLENPDNIVVTHDGGLVICSDASKRTNPLLLRLSANANTIFPIAEFPLPVGVKASEFTGAVVHNDWLFVNIQDPGMTFAITGPWQGGKV